MSADAVHDIRQHFAQTAQEFERLRGPELKDLLLEIAEDAINPEPWMPTGLDPLDYLLDGGMRGGEVFVLAARPRVGKSALALQIILYALQSGHPVGLWSLEMRPKQWMRRALATLSGVPPRLARQGKLTEHDYALYRQAITDLHKLPLHFAPDRSDPESFTVDAAFFVQQHGCKLLVIDYLQLMEPPTAAFSRENEVATISRVLKRTANRHGVAILVLAQLNRDAEGKVPHLGNLRESGSIEQDADIVYLLHREMDEERHILSRKALGIVAKNRDGEEGSHRLTYEPSRFAFVPVENRPEPVDWRSK